MRRGDLEPLNIGAVRHDPVPPQHPEHMRLVVEHVFLEPAHRFALPGRVDFAQHLLVELDLGGVFIMPVILGIDGGRQCLLDIERRIDIAVAGRFEHDIEFAIAHRIEPRPARQDPLRHMQSCSIGR
jgi:hypothetical protein